MVQVGAIGLRKLTNMFRRGAAEDLVTLEFVEEMDREAKYPRRYRILKPLPTKDEYTALVKDHYTRSVATWWDVVEEELNALKEEMEDWRSSLQGAGLDSTEKYGQVEEAEDGMVYVLEEMDFKFGRNYSMLAGLLVEVNPMDLFVSCSHRRRAGTPARTGRGWRASEVCSILEAVEKAAVVLMNDEIRGSVKSGEKKGPVTDYIGKVWQVREELANIRFPTAF